MKQGNDYRVETISIGTRAIVRFDNEVAALGHMLKEARKEDTISVEIHIVLPSHKA